MSTKRSRPIPIGKFPVTVPSAGIVDSSTSPRSPLDCVMDSPRGPKKYDQQGGIGLGIVVALNDNNNNNSNYKGEILAKYALCGQFSYRSNPIQMNNYSNVKNKEYECNNNYESVDDMLEDEFTYVTCHGPNKSITTKVYCDGGDYGRVIKREISQNLGVFKISSPATLFDDHCGRSDSDSDSDFLSSCHLCRKTLHGKDIYMYRGENAFCSEECRQNQICIDERKEQCRSQVSRSSNNVSNSSYYSNEIIAI